MPIETIENVIKTIADLLNPAIQDSRDSTHSFTDNDNAIIKVGDKGVLADDYFARNPIIDINWIDILGQEDKRKLLIRDILNTCAIADRIKILAEHIKCSGEIPYHKRTIRKGGWFRDPIVEHDYPVECTTIISFKL